MTGSPASLCKVPWMLLLALAACAEAAGDEVPLAAPADAGCEPSEPPGPGLVHVNGQGAFVVDGQPFVPRGVNSYPLLQHVGLGELAAVRDIFDQAVALGRPLVRTPAFLDGGENPARIRERDGTLREAGLVALDTVLAEAAARDVRLLLTLTNNWADFGGAPAVMAMVAPGERLPKNAFWSDARALEAQLAYQAALAGRVNTMSGRAYADDPAIFAWELANEPRCEAELTPELCDEHTLASWARRMADGLREAGVQQLIAWGGAGYAGQHGEDLRKIGEQGGVDVLTLHMYGSRALPRPGLSFAASALLWGQETLQARAQLASELGLPLLLEEVNWQPAQELGRDGERAAVLRAWLSLASELHVGSLPWMIGEQGREDYDGYLIRPSDLASTRELLCR